jgi:butyrate kinase
MARHYARSIHRPYESLDLVVVMLGGGISVAAHHRGRMVDATDGIQGDGAFSNNRCCGVPVGALVELCYSGVYDLEGMRRHINGQAGLMAYLGTTDVRAVEKAATSGDALSREVLEAMCYQTAKDIGAYATVLKGHVDAILLIGGMANSAYLTGLISERVASIAPVVVLPGEREMEALAAGAYLALVGEVPVHQFTPRAALVTPG